MEKRRGRVKAGCGRAGAAAHRCAMDARTEREKRLAEALRANLRRRKAQGREVESGGASDDEAEKSA
jgi:hypothetical protein